MTIYVFLALLLPFLGTAAGAACVFFLKRSTFQKLGAVLSGFAAGVMVAASIWSLLTPAIERSSALGRLAFLPAAAGIWCGICLFLLLDRRLSNDSRDLVMTAVTLHNLPEGMAVGAAAAGLLGAYSALSPAAVLTLSLGIALQNFPEGAIISMPLAQRGKGRAFALGVLSGIVEPLGGLLTILFSHIAVPLLPFLLAFSAGAMLYVVVAELIPEASDSRPGIVGFAAGFTLMMAMDLALG